MNTQAQDYVPPEDEDYNPIHSSNASRTSKRTTDSQPDVAMADARDSEHPECECNVDVSTRICGISDYGSYCLFQIEDCDLVFCESNCQRWLHTW